MSRITPPLSDAETVAEYGREIRRMRAEIERLADWFWDNNHADARAELERIRTLAQRWATNVEPNKNYSGRWIAHMVTSILEGPTQ